MLQGEVYLETSAGETFRAVASTSGATLGGPLEPATRSLSGGASLPLPNCFQLGTSQPEWYVLLAYDDFEALPCQVISPYGAYARGLSENISSGVVLWQHAPETSVLAHAARKGFKGLKDTDLQPLLRELDLQSLGCLICITSFGSFRFYLFFWFVFYVFFYIKQKIRLPPQEQSSRSHHDLGASNSAWTQPRRTGGDIAGSSNCAACRPPD